MAAEAMPHGAGLGEHVTSAANGYHLISNGRRIATHQGLPVPRGPTEDLLPEGAHVLLARVQNAPAAGGIDERRIEIARLDPVKKFERIAL